MTMESIYELIKNRSAEDIIRAALQHHLNSTETNLEILADQFETCEFKRITQPLSYFDRSVADIIDHWDEYLWLHTALADDRSKKTLEHLLLAKLTMDTTHLEKAFSREAIYFDKAIWGELGQEVFVDCGSYEGDSILQFIRHCPQYREIYAIEAIPEVMARCKATLNDDFRDIHFLTTAVSNQQKTVLFDAGTMHGESRVSLHGSISVDAIPLDNLKQSGITFLKMDIEGSELDAIAGAQRIIKNDAPKMAICIYHRPEDFRLIPKAILEINPGYTFKIRQHDYEVYSETVLYCLPPESKTALPPPENHKVLYERLHSATEKLVFLTTQDFENLLQHGFDKKWFLQQLQHLSQQNTAAQVYINDLITAKSWQEQQTQNFAARSAELEIWCTQLEEGKNWLEQQNTVLLKNQENLENQHAQLNSWCAQLEEGKNWLEQQNTSLTETHKTLESQYAQLHDWCGQLEEGKQWLEDQVQIRDEENARLQKELLQLQEELASVNNNLSRTRYEYKRLEADYLAVPSFIRKLTKKQ